ADVSNNDSVTRAVEETLASTRGVDILINNAGITGPNATLWDYPIDGWKRVFAVNVEGVFQCCGAFVPVMRERNYGRIVNIASVAGKDGNPNASAYSASKAAVIALTKSLGKELADTAIRVNCVTPAAVRTPLFAQMSESHIAYMLAKIPLGRFGEPCRRRLPRSSPGLPRRNARSAPARFSISPAAARRINVARSASFRARPKRSGGREPGIHNPGFVVMDSGFAAPLRTPSRLQPTWALKLADLG